MQLVGVALQQRCGPAQGAPHQYRRPHAPHQRQCGGDGGIRQVHDEDRSKVVATLVADGRGGGAALSLRAGLRPSFRPPPSCTCCVSRAKHKRRQTRPTTWYLTPIMMEDDDVDWDAIEAAALQASAAKKFAEPAAVSATTTTDDTPTTSQNQSVHLGRTPAPPSSTTADTAGVTSSPWVSTMSLSEKSRLDEALLSMYGYDSFREGQREVVEAALAGKDVAVFWATGAASPSAISSPRSSPTERPSSSRR